MIEKGNGSPSPEVFLTVLFEASGGDKSGLKAVRSIVNQGLTDPIQEAKIDAEKGMLGNAMEYLLASNLTPIEKITLARELSITASQYFADNPAQTELERSLATKAEIVTQKILEFLPEESEEVNT